MGDQIIRPKVHPSPPNYDDPETPPPPPASAPAAPTAPLIPPTSQRSSEKAPPPPQQHRQYQRGCCRHLCRWLCCTLLVLILVLVVIVGVFAAVLFLGFHPKIPKYSIESFRVTQFNQSSDDSLYATIHVNVSAYNPNKKIGIYYEEGSHLSVWHDDVELCEGSLPVFYQGHRNTTTLDVSLDGHIATNATRIAAEVSVEATEEGGVPLRITGKVPVRIKLGKLKLKKIKFKVRCHLLVDSFTPNDQIRITNSACKIKLQFSSIFS